MDATNEHGAADEEQRNILERFNRNLSLVEYTARQTFRTIKGLVEMDELVSAGREGLYEAARKFDPSKSVPFAAYANYRVRGAILDTVRRSSRLPRSMHQRLAATQASGAIGMGTVAHIFMSIDSVNPGESPTNTIDTHLAAVTTAAVAQMESEENGDSDAGSKPGANPEKALERHEMLELVRTALPGLRYLERRVIEGRYFEHLDDAEIAKALNCQSSWVSRLHARAIAQLTKRLAGTA